MVSNKQSFLTKEYRQELDGLINRLCSAEIYSLVTEIGYGSHSDEWVASNLSDAELNLRKFLDVATEKE